ncbi:MAG TPA: hypothetical protein VKQ08_00250 [Cyclobacteriaceae bacterium]|nr:hypothetical protein [Cyclobacteriaceae bacterium]
MKDSEILAWRKTQQGLKNFIYRKVRDKALADDIVQDVFLKVQFVDMLLQDERVLKNFQKVRRRMGTKGEGDFCQIKNNYYYYTLKSDGLDSKTKY